jgi:hypothetical protein
VPLTPFIGLVARPPEQDLLRCAKYLFVAATVAWVHPGACYESANQKTEGQSAFGTVKFPGAAKAKRRRHHRQARFSPALRFVIPRQRFVHGSHGANFAPCQAALSDKCEGLKEPCRRHAHARRALAEMG